MCAPFYRPRPARFVNTERGPEAGDAPWHVGAEVPAWLRAHNRAVQRHGRGVRILVCGLPTKNPWLNPIEPKWLHGKRATCEPDGELTIKDLWLRLCAHYGCEVLSATKKKTS